MATIANRDNYTPDLQSGLIAVGATIGTLASFVWLFLTFTEQLFDGFVVVWGFIFVLSIFQGVRLLRADSTKRRASVTVTLFGLVVAILGLDPVTVCPGLDPCYPTVDITVFAPLGSIVAIVAGYVDLREAAGTDKTRAE